jgi:hypothetical protein
MKKMGTHNMIVRNQDSMYANIFTIKAKVVYVVTLLVFDFALR